MPRRWLRVVSGGRLEYAAVMRNAACWVLGVVAGVAAVACSGDGGDPPGGSGAPPFNGDAQNGAPNAAGGASGEVGSPQGSAGAGNDQSQGMMSEGMAPLPLEPGAAGASPMMPAPAESPSEPSSLDNVLVFTRTTGYRHDAIGPGVQALSALGAANGFAVQQTEDPAVFSDEGLAAYDVVVFLSTTGDVLDDAQQAAFERYMRAGGGWVGVHSASDTEYDWAWYGQLIGGGAYFRSHPVIQVATLNVETAEHPSTAHLPASFSLQDEWYNFQANPRSAVTVLLTLDEASYAAGDGAMGEDHPIAWYHELEGGRAWYTAIGHRAELYQGGGNAEQQQAFEWFSAHLLGGIRWAAGVAP